MKTTTRSNQGISLIVLVITIIIMIILATAVILSLSSSDIVSKARQAKSSNDIANAKELVATAYAEWMLKTDAEREETSFSAYAEQKLVTAGYPASGTGSIEVTEDGTVYQYPTIPSGFVASDITTEDEVIEGLVIYEGTDKVSTDLDAATTRNQFVWVPVNDISQFVRREGYYNGNPQSLTNYTEPFSQTYNGVTLSLKNDLTGEHAEYNAMTDSVERYGGFYIGRYEAGTTTARTGATETPDTILVQKGKPVYNYVGWGPTMTSISDIGAVGLSRSMYPNNSTNETGAISTLCYGVQWDATMKWMEDVQNTNIEPNKPYIKDSKGMGNYTGSIASTGSNLNYAVKNIYDMAGNVDEWTMEAYYINRRAIRGGYFFVFGNSSYSPASLRNAQFGSVDAYDNYGFRPSLYIK